MKKQNNYFGVRLLTIDKWIDNEREVGGDSLYDIQGMYVIYFMLPRECFSSRGNLEIAHLFPEA